MPRDAQHRPGGLTALCILTIVLGVWGILSAFGAVVSAALQGKLQSAVAQWQPQNDEEAARVQEQLDEETRVFTERNRVRDNIYSAAGFFVGSFLLVGGIFTIRMHSYGRKALIVFFAIGIVFELAQMGRIIKDHPFTEHTIELSVQVRQKEIVGQDQNAEDAAAVLRVLTKSISAMLLIFAVATTIAKSGFYAFGLWYLTRTRIAGLFMRQKPVDPQWA